MAKSWWMWKVDAGLTRVHCTLAFCVSLDIFVIKTGQSDKQWHIIYPKEILWIFNSFLFSYLPGQKLFGQFKRFDKPCKQFQQNICKTTSVSLLVGKRESQKHGDRRDVETNHILGYSWSESKLAGQQPRWFFFIT